MALDKSIQDALAKDEDLRRKLEELGKASDELDLKLIKVSGTSGLASEVKEAQTNLDLRLKDVSDTLGLTRRFVFRKLCPKRDEP
jgi:hypothetical protein